MQPNNAVLLFLVIGMLGTFIAAVVADWMRKAND